MERYTGSFDMAPHRIHTRLIDYVDWNLKIDHGICTSSPDIILSSASLHRIAYVRECLFVLHCVFQDHSGTAVLLNVSPAFPEQQCRWLRRCCR